MRTKSVGPALATLVVLSLPQAHGAVPGETLVEVAARGDVQAAAELLRQGADVNQGFGDGTTPLHLAAGEGDLELASLLIYAGADLNAGTRIGGYTPLHLASRHGHAAIAEALLAAGADVHAATSNSGVLPVHLAAEAGDPDTLRVLLEGGADPNAREEAWGQTPLMFAAAANRAENIRVLLAGGADPSITGAVVNTVEREQADEAAEKRLMAALAAFKEQEGGGPGWRPQPAEVQAAITLARQVQRNWPEVPDPNCEAPAGGAVEAAPDCGTEEEGDQPQRLSYGQLVGQWGGLTALLYAVRQGHDESVLALLEGGADLNQPSSGDGTSPLLMATVNGQYDLALELLERGADPNLTSEAGTSPLFATLERQWASWANYAHPVENRRQHATYMEVLQALLEAGADPNIRLNKHLWYAEYTISVLAGRGGLHYQGATPFWRAAFALDVDAMRLLKEYGADPHIATIKQPERRRGDDDEEGTEDKSGLPPVPVGGPFIYPVHAATGAGYGRSFAANAHRHPPDAWMPAVRFLVEECGADVNLPDANGYTPLHNAAARGDNEMIQYLVSKGADVKAVSRTGQTTADMANGPMQRVPPFPETIELLVGLGAVNNHNCVSC